MKLLLSSLILIVLTVMLQIWTDSQEPLSEEEVITYEQAAYEFLASEFPEKYGYLEGENVSEDNDVIVLEIHNVK